MATARVDDPVEQDQVVDEPPEQSGPGPRGRAYFAGQDAAGAVLAVLFWAWVGLPFIQGGPAQVKAVFKAKFLNRGDIGWLP